MASGQAMVCTGAGEGSPPPPLDLVMQPLDTPEPVSAPCTALPARRSRRPLRPAPRPVPDLPPTRDLPLTRDQPLTRDLPLIRDLPLTCDLPPTRVLAT
jgi:hypothetical protein